MTTHIIINGKEVTHPLAKAALAFAVILIASLVTAIFVFVLLPIIGIVVTLSVGFVAIFIVATIAAITILAFGAAMLGWLIGPTEFRLEKTRKRH
jgi:hypothetical protein